MRCVGIEPHILTRLFNNWRFPMKAVTVGDLVVVNNLPDATLYRVVDTDGKFGVGLIDATTEKQIPNQRVQWIDVDCLEKPTKLQLSVNAF